MVRNVVTDAAPLPQQLQDLQRRSRTVLGHLLIRHPAADVLRNLGRSLLANLRRIQEIRRATATRDTAGESGELALANLIRISNRLLDTIQGQVALCESTVRQASLAAEWARRLVAQERLPYSQLLPLFSRTVDEVSTVPVLSRLVPIPGLPLVSLVESQAGSAAALLVEGLTAARVLAWVLHFDPRAARSLPALALAALWQDVGRLPALSAWGPGMAFVQRNEWIERQHPAISSGILGTICGAPAELALMVGQHHERLDGGGFPRALMARDIPADSAVLAAATRFARLVLHLDADPRSPSTTVNGPGHAAQLLLAEAESGLWPVEFAKRLPERMAQTGEDVSAPSLEIPPPASEPDLDGKRDGEPERGVAGRGDRSRHLHGREQALPHVHAGLGRRFSEPGWYEKKMLINR